MEIMDQVTESDLLISHPESSQESSDPIPALPAGERISGYLVLPPQGRSTAISGAHIRA